MSDEKELAEIFNDYFANIVKIATGKDPKNGRHDFPPEISNISAVLEIIKQYKQHPSILCIKGNIKVDKNVEFTEVSCNDIIKHLNNLNDNKATGSDNIPAKILKLAVHALEKPLLPLQ